MIQHTTALEQAMSANTSYLQCFKGFDRRRTLVSCLAYASNNLAGQVLASNATFFLTSAGLNTSAAFSFNLGLQALGLVGCLGSWVLNYFYRRRVVYICGLLALEIIMITTGILGAVSSTVKSETSYGVGALLVLFVFVNDGSCAPTVYTIVSELSSARLRAKSIALARITYILTALVNGIITPYMLNPAAWNWGAKTGFFWAGINAFVTVAVFFTLPETKGRTYGELDMLFERKTPARQFNTTDVNQFTDQSHVVQRANEKVIDDFKGEKVEI